MNRGSRTAVGCIHRAPFVAGSDTVWYGLPPSAPSASRPRAISTTVATTRADPTERVNAISSFGFTERQARFLLNVLRHAGVFVERQYCSFAGIVHGQRQAPVYRLTWTLPPPPRPPSAVETTLTQSASWPL
jgi:hypothetical protein